MNKKDKDSDKKFSKITLLFIMGVLFVCISPWLFIHNAFISSLDFSNSGQIGDSIGGITSPIVGLLGGLLVFYSFREQVKANKIQSDRLDLQLDKEEKAQNFNSLMINFNELKKECENILYIDQRGLTNAIDSFISNEKTSLLDWGKNPLAYQNEISFDQKAKVVIDFFNIMMYSLTYANLNDIDRRLLSNTLTSYILNNQIDLAITRLILSLDSDCKTHDKCITFDLNFSIISKTHEMDFKIK